MNFSLQHSRSCWQTVQQLLTSSSAVARPDSHRKYVSRRWRAQSTQALVGKLSQPITRRKSTVSNREVEHSQYLIVDSKAVFLYRKVDYSQYLVVDSKAEYLHREVVLYREAACPYKEVDHCQYLVVDSKVV